MNDILLNRVRPHCSEIALTEMVYVICREKGWEQAVWKKDKLLHSNTIIVEATSKLFSEAAHEKCMRSISLQDCYTIALARMLHCEAVFAKHEDELDREIKRKPFDIPITYLSSSR